MHGPNGAGTDIDAIYTLLGTSRRRYLLYQLLEREYGNVEELSLQIAAWEAETSMDAVDEERRQRVYVSLVHNHLPRLADHDVVDYDLRSGDVVKRAGFADLEPVLEQFRQTEPTPEKYRPVA
ncbi:DUF7344 domain-containing protein [Natronobeatus ordinarius]|uniref:DUF7344 domain-containing protein n=1 Tax=Natronobeatus ordinarius TaxID=2963433 RepID=UPI0020CE04CF|nr:hypothetical protein [Natronobeatus ordinarius]